MPTTKPLAWPCPRVAQTAALGAITKALEVLPLTTQQLHLPPPLILKACAIYPIPLPEMPFLLRALSSPPVELRYTP